MSRPQLEVADIFRAYGAQFRKLFGASMSREQHRAMRAIEICRTATLGGHVDQCDSCAHQRISYNSCRNRHCPKCQSLAKAKWLQSRMAELLPIACFHVVFTLPREIAAVAFQNMKVTYTILFRAVSQTLLEIAADPKRLGAEIGFLAVLHTWTQTLMYHPHVHCVVPGGGLSPDHTRWISSRQKFFLPVKVLSCIFRGKFLFYLKQAFDQGKLNFFGDLKPLAHPQTFSRFLRRNRKIKWIVYAKPPFGGPAQVLDYLGRYTHRIAISNHRLLSFHDDKVTFQWKDRKTGHCNKTLTLDAQEFIRRFLIHVLPHGFPKIRYFGFLANRQRSASLLLCRQLLNASGPETDPQILDWKSRHQALTGDSLELCPICRQGRMLLIQTLVPLWTLHSCRRRKRPQSIPQSRIHSP